MSTTSSSWIYRNFKIRKHENLYCVYNLKEETKTNEIFPTAKFQTLKLAMETIDKIIVSGNPTSTTLN